MPFLPDIANAAYSPIDERYAYTWASTPHFVSTDERSLEDELLSIMLDTENTGSLVSTLQALLSAAYAVRDRWSTDTWRVMNGIEDLCAALEKSVPENGDTTPQILTDLMLQEAELASLDQLMIFLSALSGLNAENMTQTIGWMSLDMGRRIERALLKKTGKKKFPVASNQWPVKRLICVLSL